MVQPVRGPYGSTPPSNGGNLAGQESDYIQMLEAYIQLAAQKKDISQQTEEQLLSELKNITPGGENAASQINNIITTLNEVGKNLSFQSFTFNSPACAVGAFVDLVKLSGLPWHFPKFEGSNTQIIQALNKNIQQFDIDVSIFHARLKVPTYNMANW